MIHDGPSWGEEELLRLRLFERENVETRTEDDAAGAAWQKYLFVLQPEMQM